MKLIQYLLLNGVFGIAMYFGFYKEITGFANLALTIGWITAILTLFYLSDQVVEVLAKNDLSVSKEFDFLVDFIIFCVFAFYGHIILSVVYLIGSMISYGAKTKAEDIKKLREVK